MCEVCIGEEGSLETNINGAINNLKDTLVIVGI